MSLENDILKEEKKLEKFKAQSKELDKKIKESEAELERLRTLHRSEKFGAIAEVAQQSGISVEDLLVALQSGNLLDLQEKIEEVRANASTSAFDGNSFNE